MKPAVDIAPIDPRQDQQGRLRVMYLVDSLRVGGKERQICELLKGLQADGSVESIVVTMGTEQFYVQEVEKLGVSVVYLLRRMRWDPMVLLKLFSLLRQFKPHIIHTNSEMAMSYAFPLARLMGITLINATIRNAFSGDDLRWKWHKLMLRLADVCISNSRAGFESRGLSADSPGNVVIHNGIDLRRFETPNPTGALPFAAPAGTVVGMIAEFSDHKDFPTFIRAAQTILAKRRDVTFVAVGGGKNLEQCRAMVAPEEDRIQFLGERKDIEALIARMDIGVLCTFSEGIPNAIMEFMAAGRPVIVTDGGGSRELVVDRVVGFLAPPRNPAAVAERIELLLDNPDTARQMGMTGRKRIEQHFSLKALADSHLRLYHHCFDAEPARSSA
ncbi:MAG TPA: glycosyltransferase [Terriglobia bacterium]|nr:glycosyltransferase [Terriglobia bacterium]